MIHEIKIRIDLVVIDFSRILRPEISLHHENRKKKKLGAEGHQGIENNEKKQLITKLLK